MAVSDSRRRNERCRRGRRGSSSGGSGSGRCRVGRPRGLFGRYSPSGRTGRGGAGCGGAVRGGAGRRGRAGAARGSGAGALSRQCHRSGGVLGVGGVDAGRAWGLTGSRTLLGQAVLVVDAVGMRTAAVAGDAAVAGHVVAAGHVVVVVMACGDGDRCRFHLLRRPRRAGRCQGEHQWARQGEECGAARTPGRTWSGPAHGDRRSAAEPRTRAAMSGAVGTGRRGRYPGVNHG